MFQISRSTFARVRDLIMENPSFVLLDDDSRVIGAAGIMVVHPGVGEAWLLTAPLASARIIPAFRILRRWLDQMQDQLKLRRVQALIVPTPQAAKLSGMLGFEPEGLMRQFGVTGEDLVMASRIRSY